MHAQSAREEEKSLSGKKLESPKKSNFFPLELFSSNFFLVHTKLEVLKRWQTTHFKAYQIIRNGIYNDSQVTNSYTTLNLNKIQKIKDDTKKGS